MPRDQVTVARGDQVRLDVVRAHLDRKRVRRERVLGPIARCAAMRDHERRLAVERAPGSGVLHGRCSLNRANAERERREQQEGSMHCRTFRAWRSVDEEIRQEVAVAGRDRVAIQVLDAGLASTSSSMKKLPVHSRASRVRIACAASAMISGLRPSFGFAIGITCTAAVAITVRGHSAFTPMPS